MNPGKKREITSSTKLLILQLYLRLACMIAEQAEGNGSVYTYLRCCGRDVRSLQRFQLAEHGSPEVER